MTPIERAVLAAIRHPSEAMIADGLRIDREGMPVATWMAMIDAALREG